MSVGVLAFMLIYMYCVCMCMCGKKSARVCVLNRSRIDYASELASMFVKNRKQDLIQLMLCSPSASNAAFPMGIGSV